MRAGPTWSPIAPLCGTTLHAFPHGRHELVFHVFGAIAQFERRLISQRTKDGLETGRKDGRNPSRLLLQPETISALQDLVETGKSVSRAAKHLGIGRST